MTSGKASLLIEIPNRYCKTGCYGEIDYELPHTALAARMAGEWRVESIGF